MDRAETTVVAGVPGLKHFQSSSAVPDLADHDPVRPKTKGGLHEIADRNSGLGPFRQKLDFVLSGALQFHRVLDQDDTVICDDRLGEQCVPVALSCRWTCRR